MVWSLASGLLAALTTQHTIPYEELMLDPTFYGHLPWYAGLVSNLGVLGWTASTVVAGAGAWMAAAGDRPGARQYLGGAALFSALLLLDDLFQLHVVVTHQLGLSKAPFYGLYLLMGSWWLAANWREAGRTRWPLLAAAGLALSASMAIDQGVPASPLALLAEDSSKFLGIVAWCLYFCLTAADISRSVLASSRLAPSLMAAADGPTAERVGIGR